MMGYRLEILAIVWFVINFAKVVNSQQLCGETASSQNGLKLEREPYSVMKVTGVGNCTMECFEDPNCESINMKMSTMLCMLLNSSHVQEENELIHTDNDWVYMVNIVHPNYSNRCANGGILVRPENDEKAVCDCSQTMFNGSLCKNLYPSCNALHQGSPALPSGYYQLDVFGTQTLIYCDMETRGGGWSLVSSISMSNRNHLTTTALCYNSSLCVPHQGSDPSTISAQKRADLDIKALAADQATFRVDVISSGYTTFFKLPSGAQYFNSTCRGSACARIITSHSYPYDWETNTCTDLDKGYQIGYSNIGYCYYVFDNHDNAECGSHWISTKYMTERVLYGYCTENGVFSGLAGYMYVK